MSNGGVKQNQSGFSAVLIVVVVVVLAAVGFGAWRVMQSKDKKKTTETVSPTAANPSVTGDTTFLTIADYKVRLPLTSELSGLTVGKQQSSLYDSTDKLYDIAAPEFDAGWKCEADKNGVKAKVGSISVTSKDKRAGPYEPAATKKIGDNTYGLEIAGKNCTSGEGFGELVSALVEQFDALEAY